MRDTLIILCFVALSAAPLSAEATTASSTISVSAPALVVDHAKVPLTYVNGVGSRVLDAPLTTHVNGSTRYWFSSTYQTLAKFSGSLDNPFAQLLWSKPIRSVFSDPTNQNPGGAYWIVNTYSEPVAPPPLPPFAYSLGYSLTQGLNQWFYQYKTSSGYSPMTQALPPWGGTTKVWMGNEPYALVGKGFFHPGSLGDAILKWVAPQGGTVRITGTASDTHTSCGDGVVVSILKNSSSLWQRTITNGGAAVSHDLSQTVEAGDAIYFSVNRNGNNYCDSTAWSPTIVLQPAAGLLAFVHVEFPRFEPAGYFTGKGRVALAWSTNHGERFTFLGNIISPFGDPNDFNVQGVPYIIKDGYFYIYYFDQCVNSNRGVARAAVSDVLNAAREGNASPWKKYSNGAWTGDGLGGACTTPALPQGINHTDAAKSSFDGAYYKLTSRMNWNGENTWVKLYRSEDGLSWTYVKTIVEESAAEVAEGYQYVSIVDESGADNGAVGQRFYVYSAKDPGKNARVYRWTVDLNAPVPPPPPPPPPSPEPEPEPTPEPAPAPVPAPSPYPTPEDGERNLD